MRKELLVVAGVILIALIFFPREIPVVDEQPVIEGTTTTVTDPYSAKRLRMIERDLATRDIGDKKVLDAMSKVPRHKLVPGNVKDQAYADHPLPIGYGQTISQPYIVALMTQVLELKGDEKVLEIGTGSGYQAAVLAEIVPEVYTVEIIPELAQRANEDLKGMGYQNIHIKNADGYFGWPQKAPFDAIIITAAAEYVPPPLIAQLKENGKLLLPLGSTRYYQTLTLVEKKGGELKTRHITGVRFVPMTGDVQKIQR